MAAAVWTALVIFAAAPGDDRRLWQWQHSLGAAQLSARGGQYDEALAKIDEVIADLQNWRQSVESAKAAAAASTKEDKATVVNDPIEFFVNTTHLPEKCPVKTQHGSKARIMYVGRVIETNKVFDDTFHTGAEGKKVLIGDKGMIEGLTRGLLDMCTGERRRIKIPHTMAFGETEGFRRPPYSNLQYDVELLEQTPPPKDET